MNPDYDFYSDRGGRSYNEDSCGAFTKNGTAGFIMADGLGGHGNGSDASKTAVDVITDKIEKEDGIIDADKIKEYVKAANKAIIEKNKSGLKMRTTIVLLVLKGERAVWTHVGDSRLYHFYDGKLIDQTIDHSVSQMAVNRGEITKEEIRHHEDRSLLIKALGADDELSHSVNEITLEKGTHAFLLCSDGFWEYVYEDEMEEELLKARNASVWIKKMRKRLNKRAPKDIDNNTAVAVIYKVV